MKAHRLYVISEIDPARFKRTVIRRGWRAVDGDETHLVLDEPKHGLYCAADGRECSAVAAVTEYESAKEKG